MNLPGDRRFLAAVAFAACSMAIGCEGPADPQDCFTPFIAGEDLRSNPANVLSATVKVAVSGSDSIAVRFGIDESMRDVTPSFAATGDSAVAIMLGLLPETSYKSQVLAFNRCGVTRGAILSFTTGALPAELPKFTASGSAPAPGYIAFAAGNYGIVIDNSGRVVWYRHFPAGIGLNFQPQPNGTYTARPSAPPGQSGSWVEIDPLGNTTRTLTCANGLSPRLHDMIAQPDGSYWLLCDEVRIVDLTAQGRSSDTRVTGTGVQWRRANGDILFQWSPFDHLEIDLSILDAADLSGAAINWTHGNALDLDSAGNLLISFRNLSEVAKINTSTGAVTWRMGGRKNQFTFGNLVPPPFTRQHGVRFTSSRGILLLDNLGEPSSRMEHYEFNENARTASLTRSKSSMGGVIAQIGGSTQSLPAGHSLVSFGNGGGVEEYDSAGTVVWRIDGNPGYIFRAQRILSLYKPGAGDRR